MIGILANRRVGGWRLRLSWVGMTLYMYQLTQADMIWNRACGKDPVRSFPGDRALTDMLSAHSLVMNGGVLHAIECLTASEMTDAEAGYFFYGFDAVAPLLRRARELFEAGYGFE